MPNSMGGKGGSWFLALPLLALCALASASAANRPNVLFLFADDMRADLIAAHGNAFIDTPHIDSLVRRGYSFRRAYTLGSNSGAVCVPSRAMLMTGRPWAQIDAPNLKSELLLPEHLGKHGYTTFATGKWHNGPPAWQRAFQQGRHIMFGGMSDHTQVPLRSLVNGELTPEQIGPGFSSELFADAAIGFLEQQPADRPFFAYVAFTAPHDPRQAPPEYLERYQRRPPPLPPNFLPQHPFDNGQMQGGRDENLAAWPRTPQAIGEQLGEYYALMSHLDAQIGRILQTLHDRGLADNTLVVFAADNGLALGSHGLLGKQSVYEHSMRVPLVLAGPGIPQGASHSALVCLADLFPTLCHTLGVPVPEGLFGMNLETVWQGTNPQPREALMLPFLKDQRAVVESRYKLIVYPQIAYQQLFDLELDPHETRN
ncbi:MAG: sulfatase-like hydrolase/transferase, partial [Planctomycetaceae bacterium]